MASATQPRPYRDFLTPSLHRRFTDASFYTLILCYVIAVWMGEWDDYLWSWFPVGPTGMRTLLLFIPALLVYVLRVAQWHVGQRNTQSPNETFRKYAFRKATFATLAFYTGSAWFYCEVYIWSRTPEARLQYTDHGRLHERIKLNERPVYLRSLFIGLAVTQAIVHLWRDYDKIQVPVAKPKKERKEEAPATPPRRRPADPRRALFQKARPMWTEALWISAAAFVIGSLVYFLGLRYLIWQWHHYIARHLVALSKVSRPTGLPPFLSLVLMFAAEGTLLALLWQFTNTAFDLYITQEPLKKDKPITSDSKDPNGSLLNGLKSKKTTVKAVAFWELALITDRFDDRRRTIYGELERKKAPTFKQVTEICLGEINEIVRRISIALDPKYRPENEDRKSQVPASINLVPQISQPLRNDPISGSGNPPETRLQKIQAVTSDIARAHSSPLNAQNAKAREYLKKGQGKLSEGAQQVESMWEVYSNKFAGSLLGWPFRSCVRRTANVVVNGAPYSRQGLILNAITTLANLTVASLKEDEYGQFQKQVPEIVRVFTSAIKTIEIYVEGLQVHWTDVDCLAKPESERKKVPEVEAVVDSLKEGLERILGAFNEYLASMGLTRAEIQEAKKLVARATPRVEEVGR